MASILVVEDERIIAQDLRESLEKIGHSVVGVFSSGEAAVKVINERQPEIVLMDINLAGEMDGIETAEIISGQMDVPIIYLTAYTDSRTTERAIGSNPYSYLSKPVDISDLRVAIEIALYKHTADKRIRASEERLSLAMEASPDGLWDWDIASGETYFSPAYFEMLGLEWKEQAPHFTTWADLIHPEDRQNVLEVNQHCIDGKTDDFSVEFRMRHRDGAWRWILGRGKCVARDDVGKAKRLMGTHTDITEQRKAEEALKKSEARFRAIYENAPVMINGFSPDGELILWNREIEKQSGWSFNEAKSCDVLSLCYPDEDTLEQLKKTIMAADGIFREYYPRIKNGETRCQLWANFSLPDGCIICVGHDITELEESEEALRKSEHSHRTLFEKHSAVMLIIDSESGKIVDANPAAL
ncbi:PAS domain S-box protein, partial [Candidatus Micrarchaeota archaeon]|nr:PAS domain S-box protein [Candidatus Micrarchaeota archaeon]